MRKMKIAITRFVSGQRSWQHAFYVYFHVRATFSPASLTHVKPFRNLLLKLSIRIVRELNRGVQFSYFLTALSLAEINSFIEVILPVLIHLVEDKCHQDVDQSVEYS